MSPEIAPEETRAHILSALSERQYRIYKESRNYLDHKNIREARLIEALIEDLANFEIFELPRQNRADRQKYQFVIRYDDPEILIHVKFIPRNDDPPLVLLGFHSHNTGYAPLPLIPIENPEGPEVDEKG